VAELFTLPVLLGILYSGIRLATPYLYAAIGEMFAQNSGVLNLGVDGIMLMGAYTGFFVGMKTGSLWLGLLAAAVTGALMGLLMALVSVTLKSRTGHQRHRFTALWLGAFHLALQADHGQRRVHQRLSAGQNSPAGGYSLSRRGTVQS
jgi:ABC-type uncharacterized transport system permease subunit